MPRTIKLATATLALLLTASIVAIIAYDKNSASPHARTVTYNLNVGAQAAAGTGKVSSDLTVQPEGGQSYQAHVSQSLHDATLQGISEGAKINVKVDPDDPQSMLVWGAAS